MSAIELDMEKTDDMIETMSMPANTMSGMPKGSVKQKDLGDVYRNYKKILKRRNEDYKRMYWVTKLLQKIETNLYKYVQAYRFFIEQNTLCIE